MEESPTDQPLRNKNSTPLQERLLIVITGNSILVRSPHSTNKSHQRPWRRESDYGGGGLNLYMLVCFESLEYFSHMQVALYTFGSRPTSTGPRARHRHRPPRCSPVAALASATSSMFDQQYRVMVVSDLDWTMVDHGDKEEHKDLQEFNTLWDSTFRSDSALVFSTGRSLALFQELAKEVPLGKPDLLVCSVGSEVYRFEGPDRCPTIDQEWYQHLDQGWDRNKACTIARGFPDLQFQQDSEQRPHKISFHLHKDREEAWTIVKDLQKRLTEGGIPAKVIYSGGVDIDVLPERAGKGMALAWLLEKMDGLKGRPSAGTVVCGDSGNDVELFTVPGVYGCMVNNAHDELRNYCQQQLDSGNTTIRMCRRRCAGGIVETLGYFNLLPE